MHSTDWNNIGNLEEFPAGTVRVRKLAGLDVAVFRMADGRFFAIEDRCPHRGAALSKGILYDGDKIACADHGWSICLADGRALPPECGQVMTFPVNVEDGRVHVWIEGGGQ